MTRLPWKTMWKALRRSAAALPAAGAVLGVAMAAGSSVRPDMDRTAEAVSRITGGDLGAGGLAAIKGRLTPSQLAVAMRHDPNLLQPALYGLTPGWESLTLAGKPGLESGKSGLEAQRLNAAMAPASGALRPALPFVFKGSAEDRRRALRCLTQAVYYEAALEPDNGQAGVAQVVLNRVRDPNYASTVCGVVFEGAERVTGCQFSFTCDGSLGQAPVGWAWERARKVAERALNGAVAQEVGTATHYHADYVHPWWAPTVAKVTQIGAHIFYRWKGVYGETAAFRKTYNGREPAIDEARFSRPRMTIAAGSATGGADPDAPLKDAPLKTVEIHGQQRVVGVVSLGGRRLPTRDEVAAINARLNALERPASSTKPADTAPTGVTTMDVEEVGRPAN
ncbi:MAG: spore germination cell wall hydrolase CwlJ-like protein [Brevundimonas sp.]|jgi:spore germination cell wall hydrolase CwlJ-like protein|uniref:cell wall hydrolase n=1 Tax=Brevundimonas sp. GW460-12-10-14-LB2 TaxID=1827469 RepID=UPI0007BCB3DD|nr:cell wall hydrolase [Brevundimonas sp. GW460-12-10-14-LB2]ANC52325.1 cell wall hydrolase [Brevundimonas sp. GW460-12-10-14-LB2]MEA3472718.1 cell wall hydrolase [Pseudomonadota bacterium]